MGAQGAGRHGALVQGLRAGDRQELGVQDPGDTEDRWSSGVLCGRCTEEVQSYAVWEVRRVEDTGQGLVVGGVAAMVPGTLSPVLALYLMPPPTPTPGLPSLEDCSLSLVPSHLGPSHTTPIPRDTHAFSSPPVPAGADCEGHGQLPDHG